MKLSLTEFTVLLDTLMGSLRIADGATIWRFDAETRSNIANLLLARMNKVEIDITE